MPHDHLYNLNWHSVQRSASRQRLINQQHPQSGYNGSHHGDESAQGQAHPEESGGHCVPRGWGNRGRDDHQRKFDAVNPTQPQPHNQRNADDLINHQILSSNCNS